LGLGALSWGVIFAFGLFASVLIHEFSHVLSAQSMGVRVKGITLMMLGGVSEMERIPEDRYAEFKLSIVGPLTSFALAGGLLVLRKQTGSADVAFFSYWLGSVNLALAIFNLIPAFPLDGGRALRSALAARSGMDHATRVSVKISRTLAWALGLLGLLSFNVLLVLIALFIYSAATQELNMLLARGILKGIRAEEVTFKIDPVDEGAMLSEALTRMLDARCDVVPVHAREGSFLVSLARVRKIPKSQRGLIPVREVMESVPVTLKMTDAVGHVFQELQTHVAHALPVQNAWGQIIGVVRLSDLVELLQFRTLEEEESESPRRAA